MNHQTDLESKIQERLDEIKLVPARNPQVAARARALFLAQAVSADEFQRHKGWKSIFRKEQFVMNVLMSILVIAGLLFGGGVTVNAAQDDLPNEPLYAVKTWSEDFSLQFQNHPEEKVERLMELAQIRIQEMRQLTEAGQPSPDRVRERLDQHIHQALQICSNMDEATLNRSLLQLRDRLREQDKQMQQLQIYAGQESQPSLERTQTMLQQRLQLVEDGLLNHETFRNAARNGFNYGQTQTPPPARTSTPLMPGGQQNGQSTPQAGQDNGNGSGPNADPGGPNPDVTPMPKNDGSGTNNNEPGGNGPGGEEAGGNGPGGMDSGGNGSGGEESGDKGPGGGGSGGDTPGGNGSGGNKP